MEGYNLNTEEITEMITLYSRIRSIEKRMYAQGYLKCLGDFPPETKTNKPVAGRSKPQQTA